jgi:hypothetical protein
MVSHTTAKAKDERRALKQCSPEGVQLFPWALKPRLCPTPSRAPADSLGTEARAMSAEASLPKVSWVW